MPINVFSKHNKMNHTGKQGGGNSHFKMPIKPQAFYEQKVPQ